MTAPIDSKSLENNEKPANAGSSADRLVVNMSDPLEVRSHFATYADSHHEDAISPSGQMIIPDIYAGIGDNAKHDLSQISNGDANNVQSSAASNDSQPMMNDQSQAAQSANGGDKLAGALQTDMQQMITLAEQEIQLQLQAIELQLQMLSTELSQVSAAQNGDGSGSTSSTKPGDGSGSTSSTNPGDGSGSTSSTKPGDGSGSTSSTKPGDGSGNTSSTKPGDGSGSTSSTNPGDGGGSTGSTNPGDGSGSTSSTKPGDGSSTTPAVGSNEGSGPDALKIGDGGNFGMTSWDDSNRSNEGFSQRYGVYEATMKLPPGGWPGFWLMSTDHATSSAPASEIDIMEATTAQNPNAYWATLHENSQTLNGGTNHITTFEDGTPLPKDLTTSYHTYGVIWPPDSNSITYTLDGKAVSTVPKYDTTDSSPMMVILGQGDGDMTGGSPGKEGTLDVKSVNVYQYASELNKSNDPGGTTYGDTGLNTSLNGESLVNTFHQDFTQPGLSTSSIESDDGPADGTPWTNHLWYQGSNNSAYLSQGTA